MFKLDDEDEFCEPILLVDLVDSVWLDEAEVVTLLAFANDVRLFEEFCFVVNWDDEEVVVAVEAVTVSAVSFVPRVPSAI